MWRWGVPAMGAAGEAGALARRGQECSRCLACVPALAFILLQNGAIPDMGHGKSVQGAEVTHHNVAPPQAPLEL